MVEIYVRSQKLSEAVHQFMANVFKFANWTKLDISMNDIEYFTLNKIFLPYFYE